MSWELENTNTDSSQDRCALLTHHAPAERMEQSKVIQLSLAARSSPMVDVLLEAIGGFVLILNNDRQILAASEEVLHALHLTAPDELLGRRPGEVFCCIHAETEHAGCGTAKACRLCGCVNTVLKCIETGEPASGECNLSIESPVGIASMEFMVNAKPIKVGSHDFIVAILRDISDSKRRRALERVMFHDLMNSLGGLLGWSEMLEHDDPQVVAPHLSMLIHRIKDEIDALKMIVEAERGELQLNLRAYSVSELLDHVRATFEMHRVADDRELVIPNSGHSLSLITDRTLLSQVLNNMVKNAFEASNPGDTVTVWFERSDIGPSFAVNNPGEIRPDVVPQIFQRTFTTKDQGLGLGTYSMKLFGEKYLGGRVSFSTSRSAGTTFRISLPDEYCA